MQKGIMTKTVEFKFGQTLSAGTEIIIEETLKNGYVVRRASNPDLMFIVRKNAVKQDKPA
jgi:hypothetical protein